MNEMNEEQQAREWAKFDEERKAFAEPHHAVNFHPEDYEVLDYLDNQPPRFEGFACFGRMDEAVKAFEAERAWWNKQMDEYFPNRREQKPSIHHCTHCGNGNVRYIVAVKHIPSGQNVVFGSDCVARLGFKNQNEFKAAQVRAKAEAGNKRMAAYAARLKFLEAHPELQGAIDELKNNAAAHAKNSFAQDIVAKFNQYGSLSPRQVECLLSSLQRDIDYAARKAAEAAEVKGPVPTGSRIEFSGEVVSKQWRENDFGGAYKLLVKLENNSKIWMTCPSAVESKIDRGSKIKIRATVEASKDDSSFGFAKRPHCLEVA